MKTILQSLIGKKLLDAIPAEQGVRMLFDDGTVLVSFSKTSIICDYKIKYSDLLDRTVKSINEEIYSIRIYFSTSVSVLISLHGEESTGPEFLELVLPTGQIIVWN